MPFCSAQAYRSVNKLCVNTLESEFTFIPDDDLHVRNALECSLDPVAKRLEASEHPTINVGNKNTRTVGVTILAGSSISYNQV